MERVTGVVFMCLGAVAAALLNSSAYSSWRNPMK
jgi:hypothetical protein